MTHHNDVAYCPECDSKISIKSPKLGKIIACRACDTKLEVVDLNPLELDWAFEDSDDMDGMDDLAFDDDDFVYAMDDDF